MAPGDASKTWARGLPNRYFHEDLTRHPARLAPMDHERPLREIAWLEVGATPEEIASLVYFLALPESGYINGQIISPNGGWLT